MANDARIHNRRFARRLLRAGVLLAVSGSLTLPLAAQHAVASTTPAPNGWSKGQSLPPTLKTRWYPSLAYFPQSDQVVLFGGAPKDLNEAWINATWVYTNNAWTPGPVAPVDLTPRAGSAMAYDPDIGQIVLFGGQGAPHDTVWAPYNDTWLYNGSSWTKGPAAPTGLSGRYGAEMAYDAAIHKLVLWGGSGTSLFTDTWLFDGTSWTKGPVAPATMSPRQFFGMAYDANLGKVVVAGGDGATDTWYFDGSSWTAGPSMPAAMGQKELISMDYDPQMKGVVTYGSLGPGVASSDIWVLRDGAWMFVPHAASSTGWPVARANPAVLYHPAAGALMMIGGIQDGDSTNGTIALTDVWFFRLGLTTGAGAPSYTTPVTGYGFDPNEDVDFKMDSTTGATFASTKADSTGQFSRVPITLPTPLTGGTHQLFGVGRVSGLAVSGPLTVTPSSTLIPGKLKSGDTTTYNGVGFKVGETVSATFPGGTPKTQAADSTGSVHISLVMPPEPAPGALVTGSAPSGSSTDNYTVLCTFSGPASAKQGATITISVTGFGKSENVQATIDGVLIKTFAVDANGVGSPSFTLTGALGWRLFAVRGVTTGQHAHYSIHITSAITGSG